MNKRHGKGLSSMHSKSYNQKLVIIEEEVPE
jgi:hypothetical protein